MRADFKIVAKAYGRIGTAKQRLGDLDGAVKFYNKSLTEHRTPDVLNKLRDCEKEKARKEAEAYVNPELAEKAREEGNKLFKEGNFTAALAQYTEAIKRNPNEAKTYNNRSLCYTRLAAPAEALKDAEKAIEVDPNFGTLLLRT